MLKFIRNYADKIDHVSIYPVIGLLIFFTFFILMLVYVKKMNREEVDELSHMPLDLNDENPTMNL